MNLAQGYLSSYSAPQQSEELNECLQHVPVQLAAQLVPQQLPPSVVFLLDRISFEHAFPRDVLRSWIGATGYEPRSARGDASVLAPHDHYFHNDFHGWRFSRPMVDAMKKDLVTPRFSEVLVMRPEEMERSAELALFLSSDLHSRADLAW